MDDALIGILDLKRGFALSGLGCPASIMLSSNEEGRNFLTRLLADPMHLRYLDPSRPEKPIMASDGSVFMEVLVGNIAVRWPAMRWAIGQGEFKYI